MLQLLVVLTAFWNGNAEYNFEELGFFEPETFQIIKAGDHYVLAGSIENRIVVMDQKGAATAVYDKAGPGPTELQGTTMLGVRDNVIYATNGPDGMNVLALDMNLNPLDRTFPKLPYDPIRGEALGANRFRLVTYLQTNFNMIEIALADSKWEVTAKAFDIRFVPEWNRYNATVDYHNGLVFRQPRTMAKQNTEREEYLINVHDVRTGLRPNLVQVLTHTIGEEPDFPQTRHYPRFPCKVGDKYAVVIQFSGKKLPYPLKRSFMDIFSENGNFLKRIQVPKRLHLVPVHQSDEVLLMDGETMIARPFVLDSGKSNFGLPSPQ